MRLAEIEKNQIADIVERHTGRAASSCVIIFSNGVAKYSELPDFAETRIVTHSGKVKRVRFEEGEEF